MEQIGQLQAKQSHGRIEHTNHIGSLQAIVAYAAKNTFAERNLFLLLQHQQIASELCPSLSL